MPMKTFGAKEAIEYVTTPETEGDTDSSQIQWDRCFKP
jgi:hypothetical protein